MFRIVFGLVLAAVCGGASVLMGESAFDDILDFRKLERIPLLRIQESVGGESQLKGQALASTQLLEAPKSGQETLYYRYVLEREDRDSDGNRRWVTVRDETQVVDFLLDDGSAKALVLAGQGAGVIDFSIRSKFNRRQGDYRHTEYRIDPGDRVTLFGWLDLDGDPVVDFTADGHYVPIISSFTSGEERSGLAQSAIWFLWLSISGLLGGCFAVVFALRIHKTLVFLVLVSFSSALLFVHYGYRSVFADVAAGYDRVEKHWQRTNQLIADFQLSRGLAVVDLAAPIDVVEAVIRAGPLSAYQSQQLDAWRLAAYEVRSRFLVQIDRLPDKWIASSRGLAEPPAVFLPDRLLPRAERALADYEATTIGDRFPVQWLMPVLLVLTAALAWFSFRFVRVKRMQENIPTTKTAGVVFGLTEVKGQLVAEDDAETLTGPVSGEPCCWYHYVVKERRGSGKDRRWVVIEDITKKQPFWLQDEEGSIRIFPGQADCISYHHDSKRSGNRLYLESRLSPGDELYVLGKAKPDKTRGDSLVLSHEKGSPYIIANISEEAVMFRKAMKGMGLLGISLSALFLAALFSLGSNGQMSSLDFLLAAMVSPVFMLFVVLILMFNDLVFLRQRCDRNWANIQVSLKKRANLIPTLENVVAQYLQHEKSLQEELARLREMRGTATSSKAVDDYAAQEHAVIEGISVAVEAYPDLVGIDLISDFNQRLIRLENEIALIRAGFNDAVTQYETRRQTFPDSLLAQGLGFKSINLLGYTSEAHLIRQELTGSFE